MVTEITEQSNIAVIGEMYAAYGRGDIPSILDRVAPDAQWVNHVDPLVPWHGDFSGSRVPNFFTAIADSVEIHSFEPQEVLAQGDRVVLMGTFGCRSRVTGKSGTTRWVHVWTVKNGKALSFDQYAAADLTDIFRA